MASLINKQQLAELQGVSLPTITAWMAEGMPVAQKGGRGVSYGFDNAEVTEWRIAREQARGKRVAESEKDAKGRKTSAEADLAEMKAAQLRSELVVLADIVADVQNDLTKVRARLLAIPTRAAPLVVGMNEHAARKLINDLVLEALDELSVISPDEALLPYDSGRFSHEKEFPNYALQSGRFRVDLKHDARGGPVEAILAENFFTAPPHAVL